MYQCLALAPGCLQSLLMQSGMSLFSDAFLKTSPRVLALEMSFFGNEIAGLCVALSCPADLKKFCPMNAVSFDHPDPSIFTVLTAPSAIPGEQAMCVSSAQVGTSGSASDMSPRLI